MSVSRRSLLGAGLAVPAAGLLAASPAAATTGAGDRLRALERAHQAHLGVYARNLRTGATMTHRAGERFGMCSTFKVLAASAVMRDRDGDGTFLDRIVHYTEADLVENSPITENHVHGGMRIAELCHAAICYSDNTAGNLLLRQIGGPAGVTRFCRSLGDRVTRLDRWETELNDIAPGDPRDTTTPRAIGENYARLALGTALDPVHRARLTGWLIGNTTSAKRFRAGLPDSWLIGDKTGSGAYGSGNDVGIAWTGTGTPLVLAVMTRKHEPKADYDDELIAEAARICAETL
ncbi:class A beta-lactamase [Sciscionella sediminilitoris]|uniref:class A beta-lactamase n=1 Tax=Sciscionella sediminilitoris TaxID=1445613 RepID=UPI0004DF7C03|nr:class A beta-lactamase [Sciscionella sp. SE31]